MGERLVTLAKAAKIALTKLPGQRSHPDEVLLAAERLAMGQPASASQFVRRLLLREEGRARVAKLLESR
jgi:hypothetical protein